MTSHDPFAFDDAAYVLGALDPAEQEAFEKHLLTCDDCLARVREIRDLPDLLGGIAPSDVDPSATGGPLPDTLLPGLLRRAAAQRRRGWWLVGGLASIAAACIITLAVVLWPAPAPSSDRTVAGRSFAPVATSPVQATAALTARAWGTAIDLHCHYLPGVARTFSYDLVVYGRDGSRQNLGSWQLPPEKDITFPAGTALTPSQISRLEITLPDGTPILRLTV